MTQPTEQSVELMDLIGACRELGDPSKLTEAIPYIGFLGIDMQSHGEQITGRMRYADHLVGNPALPALHGGAIGALLELTASFQVLWNADAVVLPKTINITIQYLRSGKPVDTFARATITKRGRRVMTARAEAWQEKAEGAEGGGPDEPIAAAIIHFLNMPSAATVVGSK